MIRCLKNTLVTSVAAEETLIPMCISDIGELIVSGRNEFIFTWVSGSVQISEGMPINGTVEDLPVTHGTLAAAGDKTIMTLCPELKDGGFRNARCKGSGTFVISW